MKKDNAAVEEIVTKEEALKIEEWTWIEGYKGTDKNMVCHDYQYTLGNMHSMPEDTEIKVCNTGFHFCKKLSSVFQYYPIGEGNRFFKVKALVRTADVAKNGSGENIYNLFTFNDDKFVAKSIIFYYELSPEEVFAGNVTVKNWSTEDKLLAMKTSVDYAMKERERAALSGLGYSMAFIEWVVRNDKFDVAYAVGSQKDLSMDMKVLTILQDKGKKLDLLNKQLVISTAGLCNTSAMLNALKDYEDKMIQKAICAYPSSIYQIADDGKEN